MAVYNEITDRGAGMPGAKDVRDSDWIFTEKVTDRNLVKALQLDLDKGEAEAIALALELKADLLLIDEKIGRSIADNFGLTFVGLIGVLVEAKSNRIIDNMKQMVDNLMNKAGFWISDELYNSVLNSVGEM